MIMDPELPDLTIADVVESTAGRDAEELFYVIASDAQFLYLVNGKDRTIEKPKKKKRKHVAYFSEGSDRLRQKLLENGKVTNSEIRRALSPHIAQREMPLQAEGGNLLG